MLHCFTYLLAFLRMRQHLGAGITADEAAASHSSPGLTTGRTVAAHLTCGGVLNEAHQLMRVPPPRVDPASTVMVASSLLRMALFSYMLWKASPS